MRIFWTFVAVLTAVGVAIGADAPKATTPAAGAKLPPLPPVNLPPVGAPAAAPAATTPSNGVKLPPVNLPPVGAPAAAETPSLPPVNLPPIGPPAGVTSATLSDTAKSAVVADAAPEASLTKEEFLKKRLIDNSRFFRSGRVLLAEVSRRGVPIVHDKFDPNIKQGMSTAIVVFKPYPDRALSIYDYVLRPASGFGEFPCVAVREGEGPFNSREHWNIEYLDPNKWYTMVFLVPPVEEPEPEYAVRFNLGGEAKFPDVPLKFHNIGKDEFTLPRLIKDDGVKLVSEIVVAPPPPPPAPVAAPVKPAAKPPPPAAKPTPPAAKPVAAPVKPAPAAKPAAAPVKPAPAAKTPTKAKTKP